MFHFFWHLEKETTNDSLIIKARMKKEKKQKTICADIRLLIVQSFVDIQTAR